MRVSWIKVCGITTLHDARMAAEAGADAIGLRMIRGDPRSLRVDDAAEIAQALMIESVVVMSSVEPELLRQVLLTVSPSAIQFEGAVPAQEQSLPVAWFRSFDLENRGVLQNLRQAGGDRFLLRAPAERLPGGDLHRADPGLLKEIGRCGRCVLGGDLQATNLAAAIRFVHPWGIELGAQVEREPGIKDFHTMQALIRLARATEWQIAR